MQYFPVIIVGAGPAGSSVAKALSDGGIASLVVDKRELPRAKTCSGIIYGQAQELLQKYFGGLPPEKTRCEPEIINANHVVEWLPDDTLSKYIWELPKDGHAFSEDWINVWRSKFDYWMLKTSGAEIKDKLIFDQCERRDGRIHAKFRHAIHNEIVEYACDFLVGADGAASHVRALIDPEGFEKAKTCVASYSYYEYEQSGQIQKGYWYVFMRKEFGDVIACIHHKDDTLALSVGGFAGMKFEPREQAFVRFLGERCGVVFGERRSSCGCCIKLAPPNFGVDNILLAGDAAGMMYLNAEGISSAIDSGYRAGQAIVEAKRKGISDAATLCRDNSQDILRHMELCFQNMKFVVPPAP